MNVPMNGDASARAGCDKVSRRACQQTIKNIFPRTRQSEEMKMNNASRLSVRRIIRHAAPILLAALLVAPAAEATSVNFRNAGMFAAANGQPSFTFSLGGVEVSLSVSPAGGKLWWDSEDGIGVMSSGGYEDDEIEKNEKLFVEFSQPVLVRKFRVSDLFVEEGYHERGWFQLDDAETLHEFVATAGARNGERAVAVHRLTSLITLSAPGRIDVGGRSEHHEFALRGLKIALGHVDPVPTVVPIPAAAWLFGSGIAVLAGAARRRRSGNDLTEHGRSVAC